jgi:hypothetical protein
MGTGEMHPSISRLQAAAGGTGWERLPSLLLDTRHVVTTVSTKLIPNIAPSLKPNDGEHERGKLRSS